MTPVGPAYRAEVLHHVRPGCRIVEWQVQMDPASKEKTAFATYLGLYQFLKMLVNAQATFQRLMEVGLARTTCVVYLDDILVFGRNLTEHNANLKKQYSND